MPMRAQSARIGRHFRFHWPANRISLSGLTDPTLPEPIRFVCWPHFRKPARRWVKKVWSSLAKPGLVDARDSFCSPGGLVPVSVNKWGEALQDHRCALARSHERRVAWPATP
jgi:hypothetical protein